MSSPGWIEKEWHLFLCASQFLTRVPVPGSFDFQAEMMNEAARYYALVGALIGVFGAIAYLFCSQWLPAIPALIISTALTLYLTGAFHEDGFADLCDGLGGGSSPERVLEIMKDSRLGTYGVAGLVLMLGLKITLLGTISDAGPWFITGTLLVGHGLSRSSAVVVIVTSEYVRAEGTAKPVSMGISETGQIVAVSIAFGLVLIGYLVLDFRMLAGGLITMVLMHFFIRHLFERRLGGYTGDCLGATQQISEVGFYLGVAVCV